eukprot:6904857-Prymnesium_polylepis.3
MPPDAEELRKLHGAHLERQPHNEIVRIIEAADGTRALERAKTEHILRLRTHKLALVAKLRRRAINRRDPNEWGASISDD